MTKFSFAMAPDNRRVMIEIEEEGDEHSASVVVDTHDLEVVIQNLGIARSQMEPKVPSKLDPSPVFRNVTRGGAFYIDLPKLVPGKGVAEVLVATRHPAYGWLAFPMSPDKALELAQLLVTKALEANGGLRPVVGLNGMKFPPG